MSASRALTIPADLATWLGCSSEAVELCRDAGVVDLHLDTFIPPRLVGYDPLKAHGIGPLGGRFFFQADLPRLSAAGVTTAMWSITTNPFRRAASRWRVFQKNLTRFQLMVQRSEGGMRLCRTHSEVMAARSEGVHGVLLSIQGGNALAAAPDAAASIPDRLVTRVTLVHLTNSVYGVTSAPLAGMRSGGGLTAAGKSMVESLNSERIFVDLAHINPEGFWDAVDVHDKSQPLIATHTGVDGVNPHWRNLDDDQIRAVADTGGVVGVIFSTNFLRRRKGPRGPAMIVEHLEHIAKVAGDDAPAIGSDYDGAIVPPVELRSGLSYPRLVQTMLDRGWTEERVRKCLSGNALACLERLRP